MQKHFSLSLPHTQFYSLSILSSFCFDGGVKKYISSRFFIPPYTFSFILFIRESEIKWLFKSKFHTKIPGSNVQGKLTFTCFQCYERVRNHFVSQMIQSEIFISLSWKLDLRRREGEKWKNRNRRHSGVVLKVVTKFLYKSSNSRHESRLCALGSFGSSGFLTIVFFSFPLRDKIFRINGPWIKLQFARFWICRPFFFLGNSF